MQSHTPASTEQPYSPVPILANSLSIQLYNAVTAETLTLALGTALAQCNLVLVSAPAPDAAA